MSTLVCFHAHPDDESIATGGTIARAVAEGHRVVLVVATDGRHGEVPHDLADGESLADRRRVETERSASVLGVSTVLWLGYNDSGMTGWAQNNEPGAFIGADVDEAAARLADILVAERADVLTCYDWHGGYGHPDHIQVHRVTTEAVAAVADRWRVPKFYWTVVSGNTFRRGLAELEPADVLPDWIWPEDDSTFTVDEDQITTVIDAPEHRAAKVAAIAAHATQVTVGPTGRAFTLSNNIVLPVLTEEHYVLVAGKLGSNSGREDDLLAGLDL